MVDVIKVHVPVEGGTLRVITATASGGGSVDLSNYVTHTALTDALEPFVSAGSLSTYATDADVAEALDAYTTTNDLNELLAEKQPVGDYVTDTEMSATLTPYATTNELEALEAVVTPGLLRRNRFPARGAVIMGWDDGYTVQNTLLDNAAARGQRHTLYMISNNIGGTGRMTEADILHHRDSGHEIAAHSVTHNDMTAMSASAALAEYVDSKAALETIIGEPVVSFAYPLGLRNDMLDSQAYGIFGNIRGVSSGINLPVLNDIAGVRPFLHAGYSWGSSATTVAVAMNMVRLAASEPVVVSFFTHRPDTAGEPTTAQIIAIMDLCDELGVPVITAREAFGSTGGLLRNPGFQDSLNDWSQVPGAGTIAITGDHASFKSKLVTFTSGASSGVSPYMYQLLPVEPLKSYTLSARADCDRAAGTGGFYTRFTWYDAKMALAGSAVQSTANSAGTETLTNLTAAAPANARWVRADLLMTNCQGTAVVTHPFFGETAYGNFA